MVAVALYVLSLAGSSAVFALYLYRALAEHGYPMPYEVAALLVGGAAAGFAAAQCGYLGALQLLKPSRGGLVYLSEAFSQASALVLVPFLADAAIPWPHPALAKVAPLLFLAAFAALHIAFKLVTLFCALQSVPAGPLRALPWGAAAALLAATAWTFLPQWAAALDASRPEARDGTRPYALASQHALARLTPESAIVAIPVSDTPGRCLTMRWGNPPGVEPRDTAYVSVVLHGAGGDRERIDLRVELPEEGWAHLRVPHEEFPEDVTRCEVTWTAEEEPTWRQLLGLRPILNTGRRMLLAGPYEHVEGADATSPNLVILLIDALGQADLARAEAAEDVAPRLLRFGYQSVRFVAAQAPAPESAASVWSVLTGNGPLRHGVLGSHAPPPGTPVQTVAEVLRANGYATAAFTQGGELVYGGGLEQGFQLFDDGYAPPEPPSRPESDGEDVEDPEDPPPVATAAADTLERAWDWIDAHQAVKFLAVIRLRDLAPAMDDEEAYDAALRDVDEQAGWFLRRLRDQETRRNTLIVVAGTHGTRIGEHEAFAELPVTEAGVHVPLYVYARWLERQERTDPVSLVDLGPTLLERAQARFTRYVDGEDILPGPLGAKPISAGGDPLVLSLRTEERRLFWMTGVTPFAGPPPAGVPGPAEDAVLFFDLDPRRRSPRNLAARLPVQVRIGVDILQRTLEDHFERWPGPGQPNDR